MLANPNFERKHRCGYVVCDDQNATIKNAVGLSSLSTPDVDETLNLHLKNNDQEDRPHPLSKNETKNIPKNYGKAILGYILKSSKTRKIVNSLGLNLPEFLAYVRDLKEDINSIEGLRSMWGSHDMKSKESKCLRILSYNFMRKFCLGYIFNSKVRNYGVHVKYRGRMMEGMKNPCNFSCIKDY